MKAFLLAAWSFVRRDFRVRFGRTVFGMLWLLVPLFALVGLAMFVGRDTGLYEAGDSHRYFLQLLAGLVLWQLFADAWLEPMRIGRRANMVLRAVAFDRRVLLAAGVLSALVSFAIKLPVLVAALAWYQVPVSASWLLVPAGLAVIVAAGVALACLTLPVSLTVLDVRYAMPMVQYLLLLATPIFYAAPAWGFVAAVNRINPLTYVVPPVRDLLTGPGSAAPVLVAAIAAAVVLLPALRYFGTRIGLAVAYIGR